MSAAEPRPETTLVILLGASEWPHCPELRTAAPIDGSVFRKSAGDLREYFLDEKGFGLPPDNLLDLFDTEEGNVEILKRITDFLGQRKTALKQQGPKARDVIFYYLGHGGVDRDYFLAIRTSKSEQKLITSIPVTALARALNGHARHLRQYLLLDCCFAGKAYEAFLPSGRPPVVNAGGGRSLPNAGTALLCSSAANQPSMAPPELEQTIFTGALLEILRSGEASEPPKLGLGRLCDLTWTLINAKFPSVGVEPEYHNPKKWGGAVSDVGIFPNPKGQAVERIAVDASWFREGALWWCAVRHQPPARSVRGRITIRPKALYLARKLLAAGPEASAQRSAVAPQDLPSSEVLPQDRPSLVVFPELAFGTSDFDELHKLISQLPSPAVVLAGFASCSGRRLRELLGRPELKPIWHGGGAALDPRHRYSGGWCWIHRGRGQTECYAFLKNHALRVVGHGRSILRLDTQDLVIFPLLWADLLSKESGSPLQRIRESLVDHRPEKGQKVLVPVLVCTDKPADIEWCTAIADAVNAPDPKPFVLLVNHLDPFPARQAPSEQSWRSLTGVYHQELPTPAGEVLAKVRTMADRRYCGHLLRATEPGIGAGLIRWQEATTEAEGKGWDCRCFLYWERDKLRPLESSAEAYELRRFFTVQEEKILKGLNGVVKKSIGEQISKLGSELAEPREPPWLQNCWPRLIHGPQPRDTPKDQGRPAERDPAEGVHRHPVELARALQVLAGLVCATRARLADDRLAEAQLVIGEGTEAPARLSVWVDPDLTWPEQKIILEVLARNVGSARPLYVIATSQRGEPDVTRIEGSRRAEYTTVPPEYASDFERPMYRGTEFTQPECNPVIFCRRFVDFENVLLANSKLSALRRKLMEKLDL